MQYTEAIEFLHSLRMFGAKLGLENTRRLAALAGNPQDRLSFIHVAGTNGKGSVCAMLEAIYRMSGRKVGLFTSPHLVSFGERIQIDRQLTPPADVARLVESLIPLLRSFPSHAHPTFFEIVTIMALQYFAARGCDLVIWETGLGGRLDATNIVTPLASVITNVGLDHQLWLGQSVELIAREKAGIIKPGVPVITAAQGAAAVVLREVAEQNRSPLRQVVEADLTASLASVRLSLVGEHQRWNAAVALATVEQLQHVLPVKETAMQTGLESTVWPGRLQSIYRPNGQEILLDGAHNPDGCRVLAQYIEQHMGGRKPSMILGILGDKNWTAMCQSLAPLAGRIGLVPVASRRTCSTAELAAVCRQSNPSISITEYSHLRAALRAVRRDPLVVIAGSIYLAGEALQVLGLLPALNADDRRLNEWTMQEPDKLTAVGSTDSNRPRPGANA